MYVWMDGCMYVWIYVCMYGCMDGWMYVCMDICMYECIDGYTNEWKVKLKKNKKTNKLSLNISFSVHNLNNFQVFNFKDDFSKSNYGNTSKWRTTIL